MCLSKIKHVCQEGRLGDRKKPEDSRTKGTGVGILSETFVSHFLNHGTSIKKIFKWEEKLKRKCWDMDWLVYFSKACSQTPPEEAVSHKPQGHT